MAPIISRQEIFQVWVDQSQAERYDAVCDFVTNKFGQVIFPDDVVLDLKNSLRSVCQQMTLRWHKSHRNRNRFLKSNCQWLTGTITFPASIYHSLPSTSTDQPPSVLGRPRKLFQDSSEKTKKRKLTSLVKSRSTVELAMAAEMKLRKEGKRDSAAIVKELSAASPARGTRIKISRQLRRDNPKTLSVDEALALMIDANLSTHQYNVTRGQVNKISPKLFPSYYAIKEAKKNCYPTNINVTETSAEIPLQSLIDHTILRLCAAQEEVFEVVEESITEFNFIVKWGCDGAQQTRYKQKFAAEGQTDENLFSISMVPVQVYCIKDDLKRVIWQNPSPSSVRYCRPIQFVFAKETTDLVVRKVNSIEQEITSLVPTNVQIANKTFVVKPLLVLSMIDGKICTSLSSYTSSQTCFLCGVTPKDMNKPEVIATKEIDLKLAAFGLSPLHAWIRFMECLLHIAYRLEVKIWQARGPEIKSKVANRKKYIQDRFKKEMGILVDMPTQQAGNTNDGNTARKFFRNPEKTADITGINLELIMRFHVILEAINCGFSLNANVFEEYATATRTLYLKEYSWYYMPSSIHKILFHSKIVIASCILPIGQLSEEAQEARNKDSRRYREQFTRKTSRIDTNVDLIHRLLISSDPLLATFRHPPKRSRGKITTEVLSLLSIPQLYSGSSSESSELESDDSD